jgi:hypothetical protein
MDDDLLPISKAEAERRRKKRKAADEQLTAASKAKAGAGGRAATTSPLRRRRPTATSFCRDRSLTLSTLTRRPRARRGKKQLR